MIGPLVFTNTISLGETFRLSLIRSMCYTLFQFGKEIGNNRSDEQKSQGIINRLRHGALIHPRCLGCPSHGANFKKRCNCAKMAMFHTVIFVMGRS